MQTVIVKYALMRAADKRESQKLLLFTYIYTIFKEFIYMYIYNNSIKLRTRPTTSKKQESKFIKQMETLL